MLMRILKFQVRRYVYNDVVHLGDMENLIDCCYVQVIHLFDNASLVWTSGIVKFVRVLIKTYY
jgi:hypothetical protein